jgi:hypothetical protein
MTFAKFNGKLEVITDYVMTTASWHNFCSNSDGWEEAVDYTGSVAVVLHYFCCATSP